MTLIKFVLWSFLIFGLTNLAGLALHLTSLYYGGM